MMSNKIVSFCYAYHHRHSWAVGGLEGVPRPLGLDRALDLLFMCVTFSDLRDSPAAQPLKLTAEQLVSAYLCYPLAT